MFADISLDAVQHDTDHDADHDPGHYIGDQFHDEGVPDDHGPGHHHHHGDLGASSFLASLPSGLPVSWSQTVVPVPCRLMTDTRQHLPDRPPRTTLLRV